MVLPKKLVQLMKENGFNFVELAKRSGVSKSTIHGWTTGRKVQDLSELKRVATVLKVPIHELVFGEPDPFEAKSQEFLKELFTGDVRVTVHRIERMRSK